MSGKVKKNISKAEQKRQKDWAEREGKEIKEILVDVPAELVEFYKHHVVGREGERCALS